MAKEPVDATLKGFTRWAGKAPQMLSGDPDADARELRLLLDLLRNYAGIDDPADLRPGDIEELLLRVYPRKVTVLDAGETGDTVPAMRDLLAFLADTGAVTSEAAKRLVRELDEAEPQFASAVMDPGNRERGPLGPAKGVGAATPPARPPGGGPPGRPRQGDPGQKAARRATGGTGRRRPGPGHSSGP